MTTGKRASLSGARLTRPGIGVVSTNEDANASVAEAENDSPPQVAAEQPRSPKRRPIRERSKLVQVYMNPEALKALKRIAIDEDCRVNDLMVDAINNLFARRNLPQIARPSDR